MAPPLTMGIYPSDSVSEVAQSLPLDPVASGAPEALAADVEYRLHTIVQEAKKFMVAGKRNTLLPEDIEYAMEALNVEVSRLAFTATRIHVSSAWLYILSGTINSIAFLLSQGRTRSTPQPINRRSPTEPYKLTTSPYSSRPDLSPNPLSNPSPCRCQTGRPRPSTTSRMTRSTFKRTSKSPCPRDWPTRQASSGRPIGSPWKACNLPYPRTPPRAPVQDVSV